MTDKASENEDEVERCVVCDGLSVCSLPLPICDDQHYHKALRSYFKRVHIDRMKGFI